MYEVMVQKKSSKHAQTQNTNLRLNYYYSQQQSNVEHKEFFEFLIKMR